MLGNVVFLIFWSLQKAWNNLIFGAWVDLEKTVRIVMFLGLFFAIEPASE